MGCFSKKEIADAAQLRSDAQARLDDISRRTETAATPQEHRALGRERASAFGDLMHAGFILTEDAD
ncbi:hypothetical protein [Streptomyces sp. NPDC005732]|uniref:hypothetical protein n=1 Tax=Streptomyces sp. NPDC005732 TaxID=3157057 RepID=UPI0033F232E1